MQHSFYLYNCLHGTCTATEAKALIDDLLPEQGFVLWQWVSNVEHLPPEARSKHCKALQRGQQPSGIYWLRWDCLNDSLSHHKPCKGSWQTSTIHWASLFPSQPGLTPPHVLTNLLGPRSFTSSARAYGSVAHVCTAGKNWHVSTLLFNKVDDLIDQTCNQDSCLAIPSTHCSLSFPNQRMNKGPSYLKLVNMDFFSLKKNSFRLVLEMFLLWDILQHLFMTWCYIHSSRLYLLTVWALH